MAIPPNRVKLGTASFMNLEGRANRSGHAVRPGCGHLLNKGCDQPALQFLHLPPAIQGRGMNPQLSSAPSEIVAAGLKTLSGHSELLLAVQGSRPPATGQGHRPRRT